ncbi:recombinase RecT [Paracoccus sp. MA]|uniref:recombinase RecT n=1 Tax=Paracoccus sp. MA TaxID=2895796 RepID=UPI001E5B6533|nr:recombinase RecT [Paracoccus sp. MA]UFM64207.1 recombinase RecT [Paracoccus sp. MA]
MNAPTLPAAKRPLRQVTNVREMLVNDQAKGQLAAVAAAHMKPERMMRLMANALRVTPKLGECNPLSLLGAMMQCASLGLEPNTVLGHAYLIPFDRKEKNKKTGRWEVVETNVQLIIGYKGYIDLARRSGHITSIAAGIHYSDDEATGGLWEYEEGTESRLRHRAGAQEGQKLHAYAIAKFRDGGHAYVVLPWAKVMKIRDGSQGWQAAVRTAEQYNKPINSPWATHEDEMAQKTAIRALAKFLPLSTEFRDGLEADGARADYMGFAMNPTAGLDAQPEYDSDLSGQMIDHDPETGEVQQVEDQRAGQQTMPQDREKASAPATRRKQAARTDSTPYSEGGPRGGQQDASQGALDMSAETDSKAEPAPEGFDQFIEHVDALISDEMNDGMSLQEVLDLHDGQLAQIKKHAPDRHAQMLKSYQDFARGAQ